MLLISAYNRRMRVLHHSPRPISTLSFVLSCLLLIASGSSAQVNGKTEPASASVLERAIKLAQSGHCTEALPLLKRALRQASEREVKKKIGLAGVHCAMTRNTP